MIRFTIPVMLTLGRIAFVPILVALFYLEFEWRNVLVTALFGAAAITDWLDGHLARRLGQETAFGEFLDPVADKLMVAVTLVLIVSRHPEPLMALGAAIIIGREITVGALREWLSKIGEHMRVRVKFIGKLKTTLQMTALLLLLYEEPLLGLPIFTLGQWCLSIAAVLTIWSMLAYLNAAWPAFASQDQKRPR